MVRSHNLLFFIAVIISPLYEYIATPLSIRIMTDMFGAVVNKAHYVHPWSRVLWKTCILISLRNLLSSRIAGWGHVHVYIYKYVWTVFQSDDVNAHSHQECVRVPVASHPRHLLTWSLLKNVNHLARPGVVPVWLWLSCTFLWLPTMLSWWTHGLIDHLNVLFCEVLVQAFYPFLLGYFSYGFVGVLSHFIHKSLLLDIVITNIFSQVVSWLLLP